MKVFYVIVITLLCSLLYIIRNDISQGCGGESGDDMVASVVICLRYIYAVTKGWLHIEQSAGIQFNSIHLITSHRIWSRCIAPKSISFISHTLWRRKLKIHIPNPSLIFAILPYDMKLNIFFSALLKIVNINIIILLPPADWNLTIKTFSISIKYGISASARAEPVPVAAMVVYLSNTILFHFVLIFPKIFLNFSFFLFLFNILIGAVWVGSGLAGAEQRKRWGRVANRSLRRYCKTLRRFLYVSATVQMYANIRSEMVNCIVSYIFMRKFMLFHAVVSTYDFTLSKWQMACISW